MSKLRDINQYMRIMQAVSSMPIEQLSVEDRQAFAAHMTATCRELTGFGMQARTLYALKLVAALVAGGQTKRHAAMLASEFDAVDGMTFENIYQATKQHAEFLADEIAELRKNPQRAKSAADDLVFLLNQQAGEANKQAK